MQSTGIVRQMDDLGRVVIPKEIRNTQRWKEKQPVEIFITEGGVTLKPFVRSDQKAKMLEKLAALKMSTTSPLETQYLEEVMDYLSEEVN